MRSTDIAEYVGYKRNQIYNIFLGKYSKKLRKVDGIIKKKKNENWMKNEKFKL